jgi:hypothetical protein
MSLAHTDVQKQIVIKNVLIIMCVFILNECLILIHCGGAATVKIGAVLIEIIVLICGA